MTESANNVSSADTFGDFPEEASSKYTPAGDKTTISEGTEASSKSTLDSELPIRSTGSSLNNWQGRVHFVTKEPPSRSDKKEPTVTNNNPWRIRFEVQRPESNIGNQLVGSPEFEVTTDQKFGSSEFEVTDKKTGEDTSTTFPSSIEIFETMPPCDTEFCE